MSSWMSSAVSAIADCAVSAVSAIASSAASVVVEKIVDAGISYLSDHMLPDDSDAELKRLQTALPQIREVMGTAEELKMKDPSAGAWFDQFRNAVEASEAVLDELEYKKLEDMVKNEDEAGESNPSSKKRKLCVINDDTLSRMREAVRLLDQAAAHVESIQKRATDLGINGLSESFQDAGKLLRRETTSFLAEKKVFGRQVEKEKIIGWLKQPTQVHFSCYSIIGTGGAGKTTLAQFGYQEMSKLGHFDKMIWICVSTNFSVGDVTKKLLRELGECSFDKPLNALQEILKKEIHSKKVLLILDDVWADEKRSDWEQLLAPLQFVQKGSKILITTRMKSVADLLNSVINTEHESLTLHGLDEQELRLLFNSYAFRGFNPDKHTNLQAIGDQMVKMLKGSPLAAKVIGSLLNSHLDQHYWSRILNRDSLINIEQAKDVMEVLKLSYCHLPADLQACFRFCSIFPQYHKFNKDELIRMWMAAGFISQQSYQERLEEIGEDYFNHLVRKSFFEYSQSWSGERYVMHDLLHELAQYVSHGECCRVIPNDKQVIIPSSVRHLFVHESEIRRVLHLENLRSLLITTSFKKIGANPDSFVLPDNLIKKNLRLLKIYGNSQLPVKICCLVHLRYLSIKLNYFIQSPKYLFPASIYKLYHLQVLELIEDGHNLSCLGIEPTRITNLIRLRYLRLPKVMMQSIHGVHRLTSLQELTFCVGQHNGYRINELDTLSNLQHLSIENIENVEDPTEAKCAKLLEKENLSSLSLKWTLASNPAKPEHIIDNLQPHPNLMNLTIENYEGQRSPSWMKGLPPLNLSSLKLLNCPMWKDQLLSWQMPYLKILYIFTCSNLYNLPNMPLYLTEFRVQDVGLNCLPDLYQCSGNNITATVSQNSSLRVVEIKECPNLLSLNGFLQQDNLDLQAIETLTIENCVRLANFPTQGFGRLTSLKYLVLRDCPKLAVVEYQSNLLPEKVQELSIKNCGELDIPLFEASRGLTNLIWLELSECANITSIIVSVKSFRSLKSLHISGCAKIVEVSFLEEADGNQEKNLLKVNNLYIEDCPNLTRFSKLPISLARFVISNVAVSALTEYNTISDSSGDPSTSSLKSSLREVLIEDCQNFKSLNGFLQQDNINFHCIKSIGISNCQNLVHQSIGAFGKFVSLAELSIMDCPMLAAFGNEDNLLPAKLEVLKMGNCGELDVQLLKSAFGLTTLTYLKIRNSRNITHIPSSVNAFSSLSMLNIIGCNKLVEHTSGEQAGGVNLQGSSLASLKINVLCIDRLSLLLIEPLRSLRFVSHLRVTICSGMEALLEQWLQQNNSTLRKLRIRDASSLKSLPDMMVRLTVLEELEIHNAELIKELPELPASLRFMRIEDARSLKSLPATIASLTALEELEISNADFLEELPVLPKSLIVKRVKGSGGRYL